MKNGYPDPVWQTLKNQISTGWLEGGMPTENGIVFPEGATWRVSSSNDEYLRALVLSLMKAPELTTGLEVLDARIQSSRHFLGLKEYIFEPLTPVLLMADGQELTYLELETANLNLTRILKEKLVAADMASAAETAKMSFVVDESYSKVVEQAFGNRHFRCSQCAILVSGSQEVLQFVWLTGAGNLTSEGFGILK